MALSGALLADFTSFQKACADSLVSMKGFEGGASKVESQLNRMTDSFSGRKIIQDAQLMERAFQELASKGIGLTDRELQRMGATATEAAAKMRAMGIEVPPGIQKIADATKNVGTAASTSTGLLGGMANQLAGMFTIGAVIAFGREVLGAGDKIQKMADQTSLGTGEVQKLMYIAGQSGTSIESLVGAVQNLQQRLGDDNSGAAGAMAKLGINADAFNKLGTYQQMTTLASAVRGVTDPTEQASLAAAIFGKTWKEILPAIKSGMEEVGNQAPIMADSTIKSLDRVGDAMTRAKAQAVSWGGTTVLAIEQAGFALGDWLSKFSPEHFGVTNSALLKIQTDLAKVEGQLVTATPPALALGDAAKGMGLSFEDASKMAKQLDLEVNASIKTNTEVRTAVDATAKSVRDYYNWVGERAIDHEKTITDSLAREAAAYRAFSNEIGVRRQEDDARALASAAAAQIAIDGLGQSQMDEAAAEHTARVARAQANTELVNTPALARAAAASINDLTDSFNRADGVIHVSSMAAAEKLGEQMIRDAYTKAGFSMPTSMLSSGFGGGGLAHFDTGGPVTRDGPIYAHAGEYVVPKDGGLVRGGGGSSGPITINLYGTPESLAQQIKALLTRDLLHLSKQASA